MSSEHAVWLVLLSVFFLAMLIAIFFPFPKIDHGDKA